MIFCIVLHIEECCLYQTNGDSLIACSTEFVRNSTNIDVTVQFLHHIFYAALLCSV